MFARFLAGHRSHFGREQVHDRAVLVGGPNGSIMAQKTRARAFLTAKGEGPVEQARSKPFESHWYLAKLPIEVAHDAINDAAAHQRFAYSRLGAPIRPMCE